MALHHLVWACLVCGRESALRPKDDAEICRHCGTRYERGEGADVVVNEPGKQAVTLSPAEITDRLGNPGQTGVADCEVRYWKHDKPVHSRGRYIGRVEHLGEPVKGTLHLTRERLQFDGVPSFDIPLFDITALQPSSHALQIKTRHRPVFSVRFTDSSPKLWEERLQAAINTAHEAAGQGSVCEFQPRVCTKRMVGKDRSSERLRLMVAAGKGKSPTMPPLYRFCCWIARNAWRAFGGTVATEGLENVPASGPFLLLPNHQSYLETMLVPAVLPRPIHAMAKSTQFGVFFLGWLMARVFAFPVRRFEIDPNAMRYVLKRFSEGYGVMIFVEGERTWDGRLQPARLGVVRLALRTGVPVIPCRVYDAFEAWPRWSKKPQKRHVRIVFEPRVTLPVAATRAEAESLLDQAIETIREAIDPHAERP